MNYQVIRTNLIKFIKNTDNQILLLELNKLVGLAHSENDIVELTEKQIEDIDIAIEQIENNEFVTIEEAKKLT